MPLQTRDLRWARDHFKKYNPLYEKYDKYYEGDHTLRLSTQLKKVLIDLFQEFSDLRDNLCPKIVNALADRLDLTGFQSTDENVSKWANELWQKLGMNIDAPAVHLEAVEYGDHYVIVWPKPGTDNEPVIYLQDTRNIAVRYDYVGEKQVVCEAVKAWIEDVTADIKRLRVNVYTQNEIERYFTDDIASGLPESTATLKPYEAEPKSGTGEDSYFSHGWGVVPVFRFANSMRPGKFARSELKEAIPLQDLLNMQLLNFVAACEFHGIPIKYAVGLQIQLDTETGKVKQPFSYGTGRMWTSPDKDVRFGQFDAADLTQLILVLDSYRHEMARVTDTPEHLFNLQNGDFPSGKALETAEAPLTIKVRKRQRVFGRVWCEVMTLCAQIAGVSNDAQLDAVWNDTAPHDELEAVETAIRKKELGIPNRKLQAELGYDEAEITQNEQDYAEEKRALAENAAIAFNAGPTANTQAE